MCGKDERAILDPGLPAISNFLSALRTAAQISFCSPLRSFALIMSDEVYSQLARLEAQALRGSYTSGASHGPTALGELAGHVGHPVIQSRVEDERQRVDRSGDVSDAPCVETLIAEWLKFQVALLAAPDRYHYSVAHLKTFFKDERRVGHLGDKVTVKDLTPELQARFREWRSASGAGGHTVSRDLAALRAH